MSKVGNTPYSYCGWCSSTKLKWQDDTVLECLNCNNLTFRNPGPGAAIILLDRKTDKFMFGRRARHPFKGKLSLVGGFVDYTETPEQALVREVKEETDLEIKEDELNLITITNNPYFNHSRTLSHLYFSDKFKGEAKPEDDISEIVWLSLEEIENNPDWFAWPGVADLCRAGLIECGYADRL